MAVYLSRRKKVEEGFIVESASPSLSLFPLSDSLSLLIFFQVFGLGCTWAAGELIGSSLLRPCLISTRSGRTREAQNRLFLLACFSDFLKLFYCCVRLQLIVYVCGGGQVLRKTGVPLHLHHVAFLCPKTLGEWWGPTPSLSLFLHWDIAAENLGQR